MTSETASEDERVGNDLAERIKQLPLLTESLPYFFPDGGKLNEIGFNCGGCGRPLSSHQIHGTIEEKMNGTTAALVGFGVCYECRTMSPCEVKFFSDGTSLHKKDTTWVKERWSPVRHSLIHRAMLYIYARWQTIIPPMIAALILIWWMLKR